MHSNRKTLAYHLGRPLFQKIDLNFVDLSTTVGSLDTIKEDYGSDCNADHEALKFYLLNHAMSELRMKFSLEEDLGPYNEIAELYVDMMSKQFIRAFSYLMLICTRESRHVYKDILPTHKEKWGTPLNAFLSYIHGSGSSQAAHAIVANPPKVSLGDYTAHMVWTFYKGKFSGGYGGKAWGKVADCLNDYVHGKLSPEMMLDIVWTLCHNNGPIFNKGMLYSGYSGDLKAILDVQRAGMIPNLINDDSEGRKYLNQSLASFLPLLQKVQSFFPDFGKAPVDWHWVKAAGALHGVSSFIQQQKSYGIKGMNQAQIDAMEAQALEKMKKAIELEQAASFIVGVKKEKLKKVHMTRA